MKWQYKTVMHQPEDGDAVLDALGNHRWELVAVTVNGATHVLYFKRRVIPLPE